MTNVQSADNSDSETVVMSVCDSRCEAVLIIKSANMKLKLFISKKTETSPPNEQEISRLPVTLGREDSNGVVLSDPFKIISRKHAKIIDTDGIYQLVDLGSANFTYLNGQKIIPNEEYALKSGDEIMIGDYELRVEIVPVILPYSSVPDDQKTMVFSSPYQDQINNIGESLDTINNLFVSDNSPARSDILKFSVSQLLSRMDNSEANRILSELFAEKFLEEESLSYKKYNHMMSEPARSSGPPASYVMRNQENVSPGQDYSFNLHFSNIVDLLLETFSKLIQGFLHFRQEFFGVTIFYTLPTGSLKELKEYLFNPDISPEEEKKRTELFKEETLKLLTHQVGLLEGYKESVSEGSKLLLQSLNPQIIESEIDKKSGHGMAKLLPGTKKTKILDLIKSNYKKYISDPYHIEKKFFRPSFLKGYQKRISNKLNDEY